MAAIRRLLAAGTLALAAAAHAQTGAAPEAPAAKAPPAGFVAPPDPEPAETNAQRARSQPGNNAPHWRAVRESGQQPGYTTAQGAEAGILVQRFVQYPGSRYTTAGQAWRETRNHWIVPYGGALLLILLVALGLFYWRRGPLGGHVADTGRTVERFSFFDRAAHWVVAVSFVVLAVSGVVMAFGKFFLLPILGASLFGGLGLALKTAHNFVGPLFAVGLLVMIAGYIRDNIPRGYDFTWLAKGGGLLSGKEVPSHRFNGGEKVLFWGGVVLLGLIVAGSGLALDMLIPGLEYTRGQMQVLLLVHAVASVLMMAMFLGHTYLGTIGMKGAYAGMRTGRVDEGWAQEHHSLWLDDIKAGKIPAERSAAAPAAVPGPART